MELQWPLIIFTTLIAWSAGLFGTQALMAFVGAGKKAQMPAWICSAALLVVGSIAVVFHLQHWERIFNGFGHLTSGITQELIAILVLAIVTVVYLVMMRKFEDGASVPKWLAGVSVVMCVVLVIVMAHSYMMTARPAWDSVLWLLYVLGNSCILGPVAMAIIMAVKGDELKAIGLPALIGAIIAVLTVAAFAIFLSMSGGSFTDMGYYYDPTHPTKAMTDVASLISGQIPLLWIGAVAVGGLIPLIAAFIGSKKNDAAAWKLWGTIAVIAAVIGAVCMRVVFYELGLSVFMFY